MSDGPAVIPLPPRRVEYCECGHPRDYHAWGLNECEWVHPAWRCPSFCNKWRPSGHFSASGDGDG